MAAGAYRQLLRVGERAQQPADRHLRRKLAWEDGTDRPGCRAPEDQNRIVTILAGAHIKPGDYAEGPGVTHVNLLRTLEAMYDLHPSGAQQQNAVAAGITDTSHHHRRLHHQIAGQLAALYLF